MDELESDFSVFHGLDIWSVSFARLLRLAPRLPAYRGALHDRLLADRDRVTAPAELPTGNPQPVDGDTPAHVVEQMRQQAIVQKYQAMGVQVTGIETVDDSTMERLVNSG